MMRESLDGVGVVHPDSGEGSGSGLGSVMTGISLGTLGATGILMITVIGADCATAPVVENALAIIVWVPFWALLTVQKNS